MEQRTYRYDVFVSYARHDGKIDDRVEALVNILKIKVLGLGAPRFNVFIDVEGIPYGESFSQVIQQALTESQVLVSIVTESYLRSEYCHLEFDEFRKLLKDDQQRKIVPVLWNKNGIDTCAKSSFYKDIFSLNMAIFTEPHAVRQEIKKDPMAEWAEKSIALLADRISNILCSY